jgi:5-methyltetrahydrofolate--homocysteine methyltransferase
MLATGDVAPEEIYDTFRAQAQALQQGGVDAILIETMTDPAEMEIAAEAARSVTGLPLVLSMSFDSGREKTQTMMGVTPESAVAAMEKAGAWMVGANCGLGPELYAVVCARMRAVTSKPIWIKANAGVPAATPDGITYPQSPATFAGHALRLADAGANVIGGCCGTSPEYIQELTRLLQQNNRT